ncbi:hypothetical protein FisN_12Hu145 [Fistulifera solaris]|uniref:Uncharacterized protein n=1 Tax=Fistulifera solaris TaxID=1519565 RepID=A0A1Z5KBB8_FISSO|nr:hypothetical protein FisN_12Hu145 [Fistulifera solaris]|eukprot:GAX23580.1 hypothetical protein FisN_12Hu145 [Fistulifera solaris]
MVGETSLNETILSSLGRKARERLTEERSKRPEIRRIEAPTEVEQHSSSAKFIIPPKKRKPSSERSRLRKRKSAVDDTNVDRWLPSLAHLVVLPTESRSRLVQLHGLPLETTAGKVKRFFMGLDPEKILFLPTRRDQRRIMSLDAVASNPRKKGGVFVERNSPDFRVFVLFDSAPTAALAVDRSGEVMDVDSDTGASIAVSMVPKPFASYFLKHMTVEARAGASLRQRLDEVERTLNPKVSDILWQQADEVLGLQVSDTNCNVKSSSFPVFINTGLSGYKKLKQQLDWLVEQRQSLYYELPFPSCELLDPSLDADPTMRLSTSATKALEHEIDRIRAELLVLIRYKSHFSVPNKVDEDEISTSHEQEM